DAQWSILLFGIGILLLAITYVPGDAAWSWIRHNLLFGVFGVSAYLLAPLVLYAAVLIALGQAVGVKVGKVFLMMLLFSGAYLVFSSIDMSAYNFNDGIVFLHTASATDWGLGPGVLGAVFGWSTLAFCGRPGANILLVIFILIGLMLVTSVTPADLYHFCTGRAKKVKESLDSYSEGKDERCVQRTAWTQARRARKEEQRALQEEQRAQQAENQATQQALALANAGRVPFNQDAYAAARTSKAGRVRAENAFRGEELAAGAEIDIDLGPDNVTTKVLHGEDAVAIGPGGTFGLAGLSGAQPGTAVVTQDAEFGTIITRSRAPRAQNVQAAAPFVPAPSVGRAAQTAPQTEELSLVDELARLAQKAAAPVAQEDVMQTKAVSVREDTSTGYAFPPLSLFQKQPPDNEENVQAELTHNAELLVKTLASFGVQTKILDINRGPSVTRYELQPLAGVKISRITGLADDIALNLATTGVRIEAPIPGKAAVGVEIPNKTRSVVSFRSILESPEFSTQTAPLAFAVGKGIAGHAQVGNLAKMPHLLIAGTTGSGKSVCTNSIIMSFLYRCPPEKLRLILIDPKMVEFTQYNGIPHLLMPVVTEPRKAAGALGSAVAEMEKRYHLLAENGVPNIEEYNALTEKNAALEKMPYIVIVIDELADLMMVAGKEVEDYICRIAQKARAAGMHLIVATQRPSVDVITGLIKANIPSRIGLSVMSQIDSRTILDTGGAEKLLGNGDMLYMPVGVNKPVRIQGAFIRSSEIRSVIDFLKKHSAADYSEEMIAEMEKRAAPEKGNAGDGDEDDSSEDPMFKTAVEVIMDAGQASTSLLQRRCKLGYARAARIMDEMEQAHIIGPYEGSKPRQLLISRQQWIEMTMQRADDSTPDIL
ncbi:MAG: DNA translocase FtsK, partial [Ruthenibacterium sp.]